MMNTFFYLFGAILVVLIIGGAFYLNKKKNYVIPLLSRFDYKTRVWEPASDGVICRNTKSRHLKGEDGVAYLLVSEGFMKPPAKTLMPPYSCISADKSIDLWSPTRDEFYPCKIEIKNKMLVIDPQIDKSMKFIYAQTQEKLAARNREKNWIETVLPIAGILIFGLVMVMLIYVTMSQSTGYMAVVADAFLQASNNFACPTVAPPV